jgi:threonine dehydrogenase-like Zn-dependent dehydrogenase
MAERAGHIPLDFDQVDLPARLLELTGGRGPDKCIDAVGMEAAAHGGADPARRVGPQALQQAILACRSGGIVSVVGVYAGVLDQFPVGAWSNRSITLRSGLCHVQRYMRPLLEHIERGELDPSRVVTHTMALADAPRGYEIFADKRDDCEKVVLRP